MKDKIIELALRAKDQIPFYKKFYTDINGFDSIPILTKKDLLDYGPYWIDSGNVTTTSRSTGSSITVQNNYEDFIVAIVEFFKQNIFDGSVCQYMA